jgi:hypothetical protein
MGSGFIGSEFWVKGKRLKAKVSKGQRIKAKGKRLKAKGKRFQCSGARCSEDKSQSPGDRLQKTGFKNLAACLCALCL